MTSRTTSAHPSIAGVRAVLVVAVAAAVGLGAWLLLRDGGGSKGESVGAVRQPVAVSADGLRSIAAAARRPIYWIGQRDGYTYEYTRTPSGKTYVRYLPKGVSPGDPREDFLTVGTYPDPNALSRVRASARRRGGEQVRIGNGGIAVFNRRRPTNVWLAYPGFRYQIEVYDPSPGQALGLVVGNQVRPVGTSELKQRP